MDLADVLAKLQEPEALEVLSPHWEKSLASLPAGTPGFLRPEEFTVSREGAGFGPEVDAPLRQAAERVLASPALTRLAWHCNQLLFEHRDYSETGKWPALERALGDLAGAFYLLICLDTVPRALRVHQRMGVPAEVSRNTWPQISGMSGNYRRMTGGRLGITLSTIAWLRHFTAGELFRIGRFEFMARPWGADLHVCRSRRTGATVALAPDGMRYNHDGFVDGSAGITDEVGGWTATWREEEDCTLGSPISPLGMAEHRQVRLPKAEWECVLKKGDYTLDMHIPAGGGMTPQRCGESLRGAAPFFRRFFPDRPFRAITSGSWIFNTQLQEIQLSSDNLAAFQRELYLYPIYSGAHDGLWFIFVQDDFSPATLRRDTSLSRAVADFLAAGNVWRCGAMFFLTDDLDRFGTQVYRSSWPVV